MIFAQAELAVKEAASGSNLPILSAMAVSVLTTVLTGIVIESWKARQSRHSLRHEVRFKKLFDELAENIKTVFDMLTASHGKARLLDQARDSPGQDLIRDARKVHFDLKTKLQTSRLFIPQSLFVPIKKYADAEFLVIHSAQRLKGQEKIMGDLGSEDAINAYFASTDEQSHRITSLEKDFETLTFLVQSHLGFDDISDLNK